MSILLQRTQCLYFITFSGSEPTPQCNGLPKLTTPLSPYSQHWLYEADQYWRTPLFFGQNLTFSDAIFMFVNSIASALLYLNSKTATSLQLPWFIGRFSLLLKFSILQQFRQTFLILWRCDSLRDKGVVVQIIDWMCRIRHSTKIRKSVNIWRRYEQKFKSLWLTFLTLTFLGHAVYRTL